MQIFDQKTYLIRTANQVVDRRALLSSLRLTIGGDFGRLVVQAFVGTSVEAAKAKVRGGSSIRTRDRDGTVNICHTGTPAIRLTFFRVVRSCLPLYKRTLRGISKSSKELLNMLPSLAHFLLSGLVSALCYLEVVAFPNWLLNWPHFNDVLANITALSFGHILACLPASFVALSHDLGLGLGLHDGDACFGQARVLASVEATKAKGFAAVCKAPKLTINVMRTRRPANWLGGCPGAV